MQSRHPSQLAAELATAGLAVTPLPPGSVASAAATFDYIADEVLKASNQRLEFLPPESPAARYSRPEEQCVSRGPRYLPWPEPHDSNLGFHVGVQSADESGDKGYDYLTFVNPTNRGTFERMVYPFRGVVEQVCRELYGPTQRVATISSTFVVGTEKLKTVAHVDFWSKNIVTLLLPLHQYRPADAGLRYWRFDENPHLYPGGAAASVDAKVLQEESYSRVYNYNLNEGVLFSGTLWHQTVPFHQPPGGWGRTRCRVLLGVMAVAVDALANEHGHPDALISLAAAANGYYVHPETGEWLTPLPSIRSLSWQWLAARIASPSKIRDDAAEFVAQW
mmetsp:Transcript_88/g.121  ORF Transcript_88/g.121 Transcript_88/m.121 type:complete len:334 (+) Transcript_88:148-1149(+)